MRIFHHTNRNINTAVLKQIAEVLGLNEDGTNTLFDYAALSRNNGVSPDLSDYVMGVGNLRTTLRKARDINAGELGRQSWNRELQPSQNLLRSSASTIRP